MNPNDRWFDGIAPYLIRHAASKAPPALAERLGEEWLADLSARSGAFSQLRFALGCRWATNVIAHEFAAPVRAAAATGGKTTVVHDPGPGAAFSRRTTVILLIVGLHIVVIGVLAAAIEAPKFFNPAPPPRIDVSFLPKPAPPVPSTPINPTFKDPHTIYVAPPEVPSSPPERTDTIQGQAIEAPPLQPTAAPIPRTVSRVLGGPGAGFPNTDDFYPQASIRLREMGLAIVSVCVDGAGRLMGKPAIERSSGVSRLDEAALQLARAGSGHYRATTEDGRPVSACYPFRVRFQLRD
jgi:TonB family protein